MSNDHQLLNRYSKIVTILTLTLVICLGIAFVSMEIKPFWVDEWFIIDNLKSKDVPALFGQLHFLQQFPRVYLAILKVFTSFFNYSYFSLRLPSFIMGFASILLAWNIMKRLYPAPTFTRYLFMAMIVASSTFLEYFAEMKQYQMDIFLSLVALWQLFELLRIRLNQVYLFRYLLLCTSFIIVPYFSYTYPIAIALVYLLIFFRSVNITKRREATDKKAVLLILSWAPLVLGVISITLFYLLDVRRLVNDKIMYDRWDFVMVSGQRRFLSFAENGYKLFSQAGSGLLFETLLGMLGVMSLFYGLVSAIKRLRSKDSSDELLLVIYSCIVLLATLILLFTRKLPCNPRLNAYTLPSIAILIIYFFNKVLLNGARRRAWVVLPALLLFGVTGNVYATYINYFISPVHKKQQQIYDASAQAVRQAQNQGFPIMITPDISYPYQQAVQDAGTPDPAVWVLKTLPAYNVTLNIPVYAIADTQQARIALAALPASVKAVVAGNGVNFTVIKR